MPVMTTSLSRGMLKLIFLRLCSAAPVILMTFSARPAIILPCQPWLPQCENVPIIQTGYCNIAPNEETSVLSVDLEPLFSGKTNSIIGASGFGLGCTDLILKCLKLVFDRNRKVYILNFNKLVYG